MHSEVLLGDGRYHEPVFTWEKLGWVLYSEQAFRFQFASAGQVGLYVTPLISSLQGVPYKFAVEVNCLCWHC